MFSDPSQTRGGWLYNTNYKTISCGGTHQYQASYHTLLSHSKPILNYHYYKSSHSNHDHVHFMLDNFIHVSDHYQCVKTTNCLRPAWPGCKGNNLRHRLRVVIYPDPGLRCEVTVTWLMSLNSNGVCILQSLIANNTRGQILFSAWPCHGGLMMQLYNHLTSHPVIASLAPVLSLLPSLAPSQMLSGCKSPSAASVSGPTFPLVSRVMRRW